MLPSESKFKTILQNKATSLYVLKNKHGLTAAITNYGGRLVSLLMPGKGKGLIDVVVGFDSVKGYETSTEPYFGATIGRYGNRIANGKFMLDGKAYNLSKNNGPNCLHGGIAGFQSVVWDAKMINSQTLELTCLSKDMEEGFPGNMQVKVIYSITEANEFKCDYYATTDKRTVINLTNHAFFNLNGEGSGTVLNHIVQIFANQYTPVDSTLIPTGIQESVSGTPFDFTKPIKMGARINDANEQLHNGGGYDHNFVLDGPRIDGMVHAAKVTGDKSGIMMDVYTMEPGLQLYSGNFMKSENTFKGGSRDDFRTAFAMETQHFPDSPNQPSFPSTVLEEGKVYHTVTVYKFSFIESLRA